MAIEKELPDGYQHVMPYLIVNNAQAFLDFMLKVFDAKERYKAFRDDKGTIMHAEIAIKDSPIMVADATDKFTVQNAGMFVYIDNCDEVYKKALENGAISIIEPNDQPYGRTSGVIDPFGNTWWITNPI
jgi:PhnB protein